VSQVAEEDMIISNVRFDRCSALDDASMVMVAILMMMVMWKWWW
jgi:hypothetical protein